MSGAARRVSTVLRPFFGTDPCADPYINTSECDYLRMTARTCSANLPQLQTKVVSVDVSSQQTAIPNCPSFQKACGYDYGSPVPANACGSAKRRKASEQSKFIGL